MPLLTRIATLHQELAVDSKTLKLTNNQTYENITFPISFSTTGASPRSTRNIPKQPISPSRTVASSAWMTRKNTSAGRTRKSLISKAAASFPGLNDSHLHVIRGGLNYNMELRWDGVPSLADALRMLKEQAQRTPPGQWVRVVGGWTEFQFAERRMPTLEEINAAAPETPVFILHLYCRALLNKAALRACGYTKDTPNPPGGEIQRDGQRQSDRAAHRASKRDHSLRHAGQRAEAAAGASDEFHAPLHARTEPARPDQHH